MDKRRETLSELHTYIEGVDKEITMLLQSLQWDRKHLLKSSTLVSCMYDPNHRVPPDKKEAHEEECFLRCQGYAKDDRLLPDPADDTAPTLVKLSRDNITQIIKSAAQADSSFKTGPGSADFQPLTAERLQATYTADERRAIHDAVVSAAPGADCVDDLALPGTGNEGKTRPKSKLEVLAELRDMRRRRAKYRGANVVSKNYSNVLRDVIKSQMELFTGVKDESEDTASKSVNNTREQFEHKHSYTTRDIARDNRHEEYRDEYKMERYEERSKLRDKKICDKYKETHRNREDKEKYRHRGKYGDDSGNNDRSEKHYPRDREYDTKGCYENENGHSSSRTKDKRKRDDDIRDSDKYCSRGRNTDASENRSEISYISGKYYDSSSSRNAKRHRGYNEEKYKKSGSKDRRREHHEDFKHRRHHDTKGTEKHSYDKCK